LLERTIVLESTENVRKPLDPLPSALRSSGLGIALNAPNSLFWQRSFFHT
jgi:hypothetical protein